ncbi:hypothetical protein TNCV_546451 [Trichonephila clavipes]|nr:hypothetical protein TNCV_546451 [Trichonephila clavipes]
MVTIDSCTSVSTSLNHRSIGVSMDPKVKGISFLNSFISNGPDLGQKASHSYQISRQVLDIHGSRYFKEEP